MKSDFYLSDKSRRLLLYFLPATLFLFAVLALAGTMQKFQGWVELIDPQIVGQDCEVYDADLKTDQKLFRGNDIFAVVRPRLIDREITGTSIDQTWFAEDVKGSVQIVAHGGSIDGHRLPVEFELEIRLAKCFPLFIAGVLIFVVLRLGGMERTLKSVIGTRILLVLTATTLAVYGISIVYPVGWIYGDSHFPMATIVRGEWLTPTIFPSVGRFFPLGLVDLNLLIGVGNSPLAYQIQRLVLFSLLVFFLFRLLQQRGGVAVGTGCFLLFLTTSDLLRVYGEVIFPEVPLCVALAIFLWAYHHLLNGGSWALAVVALLASGYATYCKEPVFGLLLVFALTQMIFRPTSIRSPVSMVNVGLLVNAAIFLVLYRYYCPGPGNYVDVQTGGMPEPAWAIGLQYLKSPVVMLAAVVGSARGLIVIRRFSAARPFEDGILWAGLGYVVAFSALKLYNAYYIVPAYVCWTVALAGYGKSLVLENSEVGVDRRNRPVHLVIAWLIFAIGCVQTASVIKGADYLRQHRHETRILADGLHHWLREGYVVAVLVPSTASPAVQGVQRWRQTVMQVFEDQFRHEQGESGFSDRSNSQRIVLLAESELSKMSEKTIIIADPSIPAADFATASSEFRRFVRSIESPRPMGALIYVRENSGTVLPTHR